ncbi:MAG TPA: hypothetical protein VHR66_14535 [Gemmataceae bacterium]|jgi:hypothetical protein|nr:hypothetical protein [Gemmataceae bacterium]
MRSIPRQPLYVPLAASLCCLFSAQSAQAGRVVQFEVLIDGKVVLEGHRLDSGQGPDAVWPYLKTLQFEPQNGFVVPVAIDDPLKATLKGKIRIFARYGGDVTVEELALVRDKKDNPKWRLDPKEVERTTRLRKVDPTAKGHE